MNFLSLSEHNNLLSQHRKEKNGRSRDRLKVILLYNKGESLEEIAKFLLIHPETAKRHLKEFKSEKKLKGSNGGSKSKLSESQSKELSSHLESHTYTKVKEISAHILKIYGIKYSNSGLTNWLHEQNFTYKKPVGIPAKIDEEEQANFIKKYESIENKLKEGEEILFIDSCHPTQATKFGYGWIKKGGEKYIKTTASRTRVNITGAINIKSRKVITETYDTINSINLIKFLKKILLTYPESKKINIIADGAGYHKSKEVSTFIKETTIEFHILPPYSPNLNPIERLWKIMNEYVRNNKYYKTAKEFRTAINEFFTSTIPRITEKLYSRINSNFQIIKNSS